jgi:hypothetical protein
MAAPQLVLPVGWGRFSFRYRRVAARSKKRPQRGRLGSSGVCLGATGIKDTQAINSGTTSGAGTASAQSTWVDVFWTPVAITPASTEYLIISSPTSGNYAVAYGTGNPYGAGTALSAGADIGLGQYDLTFRTYSDTGFTGAVPEPSSWAMMILGFAGVGYMTYRRRKVATLTA